MSETVSLEVELKSPMSRVWRALTEETTLNQWTLFQVTNFDPAVGHTFRLRSSAGPGWDGIIACEVLEVEPPHRLSYTWVGGPEGMVVHTTVAWSLQETSPGVTQLRLEQRGFESTANQARGGAQYGWTRMLEQLRALLGS